MAWSHRIWDLLPADGERAAALAAACGLEVVVAQCLLHRGLRDRQAVTRFFSPELSALSDPRQLPDMAAAAARLQRAVAVGESIALFGDSDVDGITASAILFEWLTAQPAAVRARISNRIEDGYGLSAGAVAALKRSRPGVVVVIDCGTNQPDEIAALTRHGSDVIILDHHVPLEPAPAPFAFVNPHRGSVPSPGLCSAGLALKLVQALSQGRTDALWRAVDLAALGTLADYAPLTGDNRIIVAAGLPRIIASDRPGLRQLCEAVEITAPTPEQVLRKLVPRLNAAGRLGSAAPVLELLTTSSPAVSARALEALGAAHATTKSLHQRILMQAYEQVNRTSFKDQLVVVVGGRGWHPGLMGPVAAQLVERFSRPAIAIALDGGTGVGSGRSMAGFNLVEALQACDGMLLRYGGHPQACGLTLSAERLEQFRERINRHAADTLDCRRLDPAVQVDAGVSLDQLTSSTAEQVERCAPFGTGNPKPVLRLSGVAVERDTARRGWACDHSRRVRLWGTLEGCAPDERYDLLVSPRLKDGELVLSLADARVAA